MKADPALEVFQFGLDEIAKSQNISVDEAKVRFRYLELNGPETGNSDHVFLRRRVIDRPLLARGQDGQGRLCSDLGIFEGIQKVAGYQIYDPQMECIIDSESALERAAKCYERVIG